ncbi:hypothetical protein RSOLAG1IB_12068 [Rhizoctonia solani AG-1 IB]|uniref:Reverse transcriptase Ty1/copia-type domain-containing protein n=1 Tax=Thanatephorus cucumeris (strain AG1-IB / isolate 7/3/14) TaxID=1108050 RepID=A0A0B7FLR7_THACB|nr:hypothetical protein RSOLAG1IB_12068 [Rhizoctonia solani AG-1 IB]
MPASRNSPHSSSERPYHRPSAPAAPIKPTVPRFTQSRAAASNTTHTFERLNNSNKAVPQSSTQNFENINWVKAIEDLQKIIDTHIRNPDDIDPVNRSEYDIDPDNGNLPPNAHKSVNNRWSSQSDESHEFNEWVQTNYTSLSKWTLDKYVDDNENSPCWEDAIRHPLFGKFWMGGGQKEMDRLIADDTFDKVLRSDVPQGKQILGSRNITKQKFDLDGNPIFKVRTVVQGHQQEPSKSYNNTFSNTPAFKAFCITTAAAAHYDLDMHIINVTGAYTHPPINRPLYVEFPEGFGKSGPYVMRLKKALYGAHQSGYLWEQYRNNKIDLLGYTINLANISVFTRNQNEIFLIIVAYVDDFLICCLKGHIDLIKNEIMNLFNCKDLGKARLFVGITISRDRQNKTITLTNKKYTKDIIKVTSMTSAPHASSPMSHTHPVLVPKDKDKPLSNYPYATNIGQLLWIAHTIRPNIMFTVCLLACFTNAYNNTHINIMKRLFQYLAGTSHIGLTFDGKQPFNLIAYSDSDYGTQFGRKSISGVVILLCGTAVTWVSNKQLSVSISTMEAKCYTMAKACQEIIWIWNFMLYLGFPIETPTTLLVNNATAIAYSNNPIQGTRAKHIDIQFHFVRNAISKKLIEIGPIPSCNNLADTFTKPLPYNQFWRLANEYLGTQKNDY